MGIVLKSDAPASLLLLLLLQQQRCCITLEVVLLPLAVRAQTGRFRVAQRGPVCPLLLDSRMCC
jgi:hypothetical protein